MLKKIAKRLYANMYVSVLCIFIGLIALVLFSDYYDIVLVVLSQVTLIRVMHAISVEDQRRYLMDEINSLDRIKEKSKPDID